MAIKSREKVLLSQDNTLSAAALAERICISPKAVEKHIGLLKRVEPNKGGYWQVISKA